MSSDTRHSGAEQWARVDAYVEAHFTADDDSAALVLRRQREAGLPDIAVSPAQGKLLEVLTLAVGARRVLEFGTLGGYSTLWFARAVGPGGTVVSFELERRHADVAMASLEEAGVGDRVEIRVGPAVDNLGTLAEDEPSNAAYYEAAMTQVHPGTLVIVDNVVRDGALADPDSTDERVVGSRAVVERVAADPRVSGSVVQTVGSKFYDGMIIATVL